MRLRSLRAQLTAVYAAALMCGLIIFGAISLALLDSGARATLDARLLSDTRSVAASVGIKHHHVELLPEDKEEFLRAVGLGLNAALLSPAGKILISSAAPVPAAVLSPSLRHPGRLQTVGARDEALRALSTPVVDGGKPVAYTVVWESLEFIDDLDKRSALIFAGAIPVIVAFAVLFGGIVARRGLSPLDRVAEVASEIEASDLSRRIAIANLPDELARLCTTFDRMLDRLQAAFDRERRFTSDASHELRGPLSVIHAEAELALRKPREQSGYIEALGAILREADTLETLTADLLAAARGQSRATAPIDLLHVAHAVRERLAALCGAHGVEIVVRGPHALATASPEVARAVYAVVHNALKHSPAGNAIEIQTGGENGAVFLSVRDYGPGFSADALAHAFERFWRDDGVRTNEGSGLGLAIARAIIEGSGGTITLNNAGGGLVILRLPGTVSA